MVFLLYAGGTQWHRRSRINKAALRHYMNNFDFSNLRLDQAFRYVYLLAMHTAYAKPSQEIVWQALPQGRNAAGRPHPRGIRAPLLGVQSHDHPRQRQYVPSLNLPWRRAENLSLGVVHAVAYSVLLLNTDLHVAELASRMSKNQFVRNTMTAIQMQLQPSGMASSTDLSYDDWSSVRAGSEGGEGPGNTVRARAKRSDSITSWNSVTREALVPSSGTLVNSSGQLTLASDPAGSSSANHSSVSVGASSNQEGKQSQDTNPPPAAASASAPAAMSSSGPVSSSTILYDRNWEGEMEALLKVGLSRAASDDQGLTA